MKNEAIEMIKTPLTVVRVAAFCLPLALVASCGSETGAPANSTITVSPDEVPWKVDAGAGCAGTDFHDTYFDIVVKNPSSATLARVDIRVSLDLAPGTYVTYPTMRLFDTSDGTTYNVPITTYPYFTVTDSFGAKTLMVRYELDAGCIYAGNLNVSSGSSFGSANIRIEEGT